MRKLIAVWIALGILFAPLAEAGRVQAIIELNQSLAVDQETISERCILPTMEAFGVTYDVMRAGAATTHGFRNGRHYPDKRFDGTPINYDAFVVMNFRQGFNSRTPNFWPDTVTQNRWGWAAKPTIFVATSGAPGAVWTDDQNACSTGVRFENGQAANPSFYSFYMPGQPEVWKSSGVSGHGHSGAAPPGIWRPLVGVGTSAASHAGAYPLATSACTDCDSVARSNTPDTVAVWARYRSSAETAPLIFCEWHPSLPDPMLFAMALAHADSVSGGALITKKVKIAIVIDGFYRTGNYNQFDGIGDTLAAGIMCRSDSCDTLNIAATQDSIASLRNWQGRQIPITYSVEAESLAYLSMGYHKRLITRHGNYYVALSSTAGTIAAANTNGAGQYNLLDLFGHTRVRNVMAAEGTAMPATCGAADTSIYCLLKRALARADSVFPDKVSRVLVPAASDWTPKSITKADATALDSLLWIFSDLRIKGVVVSGYSNQNQVGRSTLAFPYGWTANDQVYECRRPRNPTGLVTGRFAVMSTRGSDDLTGKLPWIGQAGHDLGSEIKQGVFTGDWYRFHDAFHPNHMFEQRVAVIRLNATSMGGAGQNTYAPRHAWWTIKWLNNQINVLNKLAGREIMEIVTLDELADSRIDPNNR